VQNLTQKLFAIPIMCDGAVALGCTELDGSSPNGSDFDLSQDVQV
jgi:hypothetical protein